MKNKQVDPKLQRVLKMYQKLKQHIGEEVDVIYLKDGHTCVEKGILKDIYPFRGVTVEDTYIPFIGVTLIYAIKTKDENVIYHNSHVFNRYCYWDISLNEKMKRNFYGDEYVDKKKAREESRNFVDPLTLKHRELVEKEFVYALKKKANSCISLVREDAKEQFITFVENNVNDEYSSFILDGILDALIKLDNGATCEEVEESFGDYSGFGASLIANSIYNYSKRGEEFKRYWNQSWNGDPDYEGTINPSILILEDKK